jgi:hypothetical protein
MVFFEENWLVLLLALGGIITMNLLIGKSKNSTQKFKTRRTKIIERRKAYDDN